MRVVVKHVDTATPADLDLILSDVIMELCSNQTVELQHLRKGRHASQSLAMRNQGESDQFGSSICIITASWFCVPFQFLCSINHISSRSTSFLLPSPHSLLNRWENTNAGNPAMIMSTAWWAHVRLFRLMSHNVATSSSPTHQQRRSELSRTGHSHPSHRCQY